MDVFPHNDLTIKAIIGFVRSMKAKTLIPSQTEALVQRIVDSLGCAILASAEPDAAKICSTILTLGGNPKSTVLMHGKTSPDNAGYLNSVLIRYLDFNDISRSGSHPSDIIGGVLAVGEYAGKGGREVLQALAIANHVMLDLSDASRINHRGWDFANYSGIAMAIAAGLLLDLSWDQLGHAIALTVVAGNILIGRKGRLSTWKGLAGPTSVKNGIWAAIQAKASVTGPDPIFAGDAGFIHHVAGTLDLELDAERDRTGDTFLKPYAAVIHAQATIEICLGLHRELADAFGKENIANAVTAIDIAVCEVAKKWAADSPAKWKPENRETADHSIPFLAALALYAGEYDHDSIDKMLRAPEVLALTKRTRVDIDATFTSQYPGILPMRVSVKAGGRDFTAEVPAPMGHSTRPMSVAQVRDKFVHNAAQVIGQNRAEAWADRLRDFANLQTLDTILVP